MRANNLKKREKTQRKEVKKQKLVWYKVKQLSIWTNNLRRKNKLRQEIRLILHSKADFLLSWNKTPVSSEKLAQCWIFVCASLYGQWNCEWHANNTNHNYATSHCAYIVSICDSRIARCFTVVMSLIALTHLIRRKKRKQAPHKANEQRTYRPGHKVRLWSVRLANWITTWFGLHDNADFFLAGNQTGLLLFNCGASAQMLEDLYTRSPWIVITHLQNKTKELKETQTQTMKNSNTTRNSHFENSQNKFPVKFSFRKSSNKHPIIYMIIHNGLQLVV